jgi:hypothetical protein
MEKNKITPDADNVKEFDLSDNQRKFLAALKATNFDIGAAATKAGLHRRSHYNYLKDSKEYQLAFDDAFEELKDRWEGEGNFAIEGQYTISKDEHGEPNELDQNGKPIRHYINPPDRGFLKFKHLTKMKDRGYVYRQEITGVDGKDLFDGFEIDLTKPAGK